MGLDIREIKQFIKIGGVFRSPEALEDGKNLKWNNSTGFFDYASDIKLASVGRETGTDRVEFTLSDGTKLYLSLGSLAWLSSAASAVTSVFGRSGAVSAQNGDYTAAQITNAFNKAVDTLDSILEGTTYKHLTPAKLTEIAANTTARHSHTNKSILDLITAAGGGVIPTAAQIAAWDSYTANSAEFVQDTVALMLQSITGLTWTYDDTAGTLTPVVTLENFTTDNLAEGSVNKYSSSANAVNEFTITLPASGTVAGRVAAAVETTNYPTGWTLAASSGISLLITHTLTGRRLSNINVFEEPSGRLSVPFYTAFSGILNPPDTDTILIEGLNPTPDALRIELVFNNEVAPEV